VYVGLLYYNAYYINNERVNVKRYWRSELVRNFTQAVSESHNIYHYRRGDAPLRYMAVNMAFNADKIHHQGNFLQIKAIF
jgi:hypothetical protein